MNSIALYSLALGKHLFSGRVYDLQRIIDYLQQWPDLKPLDLAVWGEGAREGAMALYLAAIDTRVSMVTSSHGLASYRASMNKNGALDFDYYVPGLLKHADIPELIACIAPRRVVIRLTILAGDPIPAAELLDRYAFARHAYGLLGREKELVIEK